MQRSCLGVGVQEWANNFPFVIGRFFFLRFFFVCLFFDGGVLVCERVLWRFCSCRISWNLCWGDAGRLLRPFCTQERCVMISFHKLRA